MTVEQIGHVMHEANRAFCESIGDHSQTPWNLAPEWQRDATFRQIEMLIMFPNTTPEYQHEQWCEVKIKDGWKYGPVKDPSNKVHNCLVPYDELPFEQRMKDYLVSAVVRAFVTAATAEGILIEK